MVPLPTGVTFVSATMGGFLSGSTIVRNIWALSGNDTMVMPTFQVMIGTGFWSGALITLPVTVTANNASTVSASDTDAFVVLWTVPVPPTPSTLVAGWWAVTSTPIVTSGISPAVWSVALLPLLDTGTPLVPVVAIKKNITALDLQETLPSNLTLPQNLPNTGADDSDDRMMYIMLIALFVSCSFYRELI
jgi:hypothetical protein